MARSRNIKPGLFKNELLGQADPFVSLLFISLWSLADKNGRLEDRPLRIKAETFPYRNIEERLFNGYLTTLQQLGFIDRYVVNNLPIIQVINFRKHQSPHSTEKAGTLPENPSPQPLTCNTPLDNDGLTVQERPDSLIPDSLIPDIPIKDNPKNNVSSLKTELKSKANVKNKKSKKPKFTEKDEQEFQQFFSKYPNPVGELKARKAWDKKRPPLEKVMQTLEWQMEEYCFGDGHDFAPKPEKYIADERWNDRKPKTIEPRFVL